MTTSYYFLNRKKNIQEKHNNFNFMKIDILYISVGTYTYFF